MGRAQRPKFTVLTHFEELRRRLLLSLAVLFSLWVVLFAFFSELLPFLLWPYQRAFPGKDLSLVFTTLPEAIMAALKSTFFLALAGTLPFILFQAWRFFSPALFPEEKRLIRKVFGTILVLFLFGVGAAYFLVLPVLLKFFLGLGYQRFIPYLRIQSYLSFLGKGLLVAGLIAQIPGIVAVLVKLEIISARLLRRFWFYFLGGTYLVALFIAPGDFLSQILLTLIFCSLCWLGFGLARLL